jgi:hypothetical protein
MGKTLNNLLGMEVAGMLMDHVIMDHSRNFPAFSTSKNIMELCLDEYVMIVMDLKVKYHMM